MSDNMAVMYLGKLVKMVRTGEVFNKMALPFTKALISAVSRVSSGEQKQTIFLKDEIPSPINPPSGCYFHTRCPLCACHLYDVP